MKHPVEIAFDEAIRALTIQASNLESLRARAGLLLTAGAVSASLFGLKVSKHPHVWFWLATGAFVLLLAFVMAVLWPVKWKDTSNAYSLVTLYVDGQTSPAAMSETMLRDLSVYCQDGYDENLRRLARMYRCFVVAMLALGAEVAFLAITVRYQ